MSLRPATEAITVLDYAGARQAVEDYRLSNLPNKPKFTWSEVQVQIHKAALDGFNTGATWAQAHHGDGDGLGRLTEDQKLAIVGPVQWQHSYHFCNCSDDAPYDPEAYMSGQCASSYNAGVLAQRERLALLSHVWVDKRASGVIG